MSREAQVLLDDPWLNPQLGTSWLLRERGCYAYLVAREPGAEFSAAGVEEGYTLFADDRSGLTQTRAARRAPGVLLRVSAWSARGTFQRLEVSLVDEIGEVSATYERSDSGLTVSVSDRQGRETTHAITLNATCVWLPLTRNFLGHAIGQVAAQPHGASDVMVPDIRDPSAPGALAPIVQRRESFPIQDGESALEAAGRHWSCQAYRFIGGPYNRSATFWVCQLSGRLIRYSFAADSGERWAADLVHFESHGS